MAGLLSLLVCAAVCALSIFVVAKAAAASPPAVVWADEREEEGGLLLASRCNDSYFGLGGGAAGIAVPV